MPYFEKQKQKTLKIQKRLQNALYSYIGPQPCHKHHLQTAQII